jgi:hypothetical protein
LRGKKSKSHFDHLFKSKLVIVSKSLLKIPCLRCWRRQSPTHLKLPSLALTSNPITSATVQIFIRMAGLLRDWRRLCSDQTRSQNGMWSLILLCASVIRSRFSTILRKKALTTLSREFWNRAIVFQSIKVSKNSNLAWSELFLSPDQQASFWERARYFCSSRRSEPIINHKNHPF